MQQMKRIIALALVLALCFGIVGCSAQPKTQLAGTGSGNKPGNSQSTVRPSVPTVPDNRPDDQEQTTNPTAPSYSQLDGPVASTMPTEAPQREELYEILDLVGGGAVSEDEISDLTEDELTDLIGDLLENSVVQNPVQDPAQNPGSDVSGEIDAGNVAEDGILEQPFDQLYPELMEQVEFSGESVTVKLDNSISGELTDGIRQAGVGALELLFDLGEASWYEAKLTAGTEPASAVTALRALDEVITADYNYAAHAHDLGDAQELYEGITGNEMVSEQWYLKHFGIREGYDVLANAGGSPSVVVAVIDTGVDYTHSDLADSIWINQNEIPDNGLDDDDNGYVDDYYGVNVVNSYSDGYYDDYYGDEYYSTSYAGNPYDDNGHGTHVAGIIAAQNNYMGTVGIAYNVKIMVIKALNHEGVTNDVAIMAAVRYAIENGAEVINMSFGQEAMSLGVQEVLASASNSCVLVASAGNSGAANEGSNATPNYPAALPYVLGVMSVDENGQRSDFSNYDVNGYNGIEYELYAPGEGILSTIPGNRYASWSGTSMAAPMVSAMAALLRGHFADRNKYDTKFLYGQLTATSSHYVDDSSRSPIVNLHSALTKLPQPDVGLSDYDLFDTKYMEGNSLNNGDGVVDSGETLALGITLRNRWGSSENTTVTLSAGDDPYVTIANPTVDFGSIGTYSTKNSGKVMEEDVLVAWEDPFYITVSEDCPGNHLIELELTISSTNGLNPDDEAIHTNVARIALQVRNGSLLPTRINEDMTLKSGNLYIVYDATVINEGVTVTVEPGAQIQFWSSDREDPYADQYMPSLTVKGNLLVEGTQENPVSIFPGTVYRPNGEGSIDGVSNNYAVRISSSGYGVVSLVHADVTNLVIDSNIAYAYGSTFRYTDYYLTYRYLSSGKVQTDSVSQDLSTIDNMEKCVFYKVGGVSDYYQTYVEGNAKSCIFVDSNVKLDNLIAQDCLFLGNTFVRVNRNQNWNSETNQYEYVTYLTHYASSYNATHSPNSYVFNDRINIHYRPETGTTYLAVQGYYHPEQLALYVEQIHGDYPELAEQLEEMTGHYAVIETQEEFNWLSSHLGNASYQIDLRYDYLSHSYTWSDGTPLAEELHYLIPDSTYLIQELGLCKGTFRAFSDYYYEGVDYDEEESSGTYRLYEIPGPVYVTDIRLSEYNVLVDMESTYQIKYTTAPVNVPTDELIFESDNEEVATVDEFGVVTPVSEGDANIYVYCLDRGVSNYITIHVREYRALESIAFATEYAETPIGETLQTDLQYTPVNTTRKNVTYTSSDNSIATVDSQGRVKGLASGTVTITATSSEVDEFGEPITATTEVTVYRKLTGIALSKDILLASMDSYNLDLPTLTLTPADAEPVLSWRSTDPEVADFDSKGNLSTYAPGTTTIVVADLRTGLYTSFILLVSDSDEQIQIKDIQVYSDHHLVLADNGNLYYWGTGDTSPSLIRTDIEKFHLSPNRFFALTQDNTLLWSYPSSIKYNSFDSKDCMFDHVIDLQAPADYNHYYILTDDGFAYYWEDSNAYSTSAELLNLDGIVQMAIGNYYSYFLTENGEIYCSETGSISVSQDPVATNAKMLANTVNWFDGSSHYYLGNDNNIYRLYPTSSSRAYEYYAPTGMDQMYLYSYNCFGIKDGKIYAKYQGSYDNELVTDLENITFITNNYSLYYAATEEGLLYGWGSFDGSGYGHFMGLTSSNNVKEPLLLPLFEITNNFRLMDTNLIDGKVLIDEKLELEFSNALLSASAKLYANGQQIPVTTKIHDENRLSVSISSGFKDDTTYQLVFPKNGLIAPYGVESQEEITITFTTEFFQTETKLNVDIAEESAPMDVLNVSDWSELDLEWYITDETILSINEDHEMVPLNPGVTTVRLTEHRSGFVCEFDVSVFDYEELEIVDEEALTLNAFFVDELGRYLQDLMLDLSKVVDDFENVNTDSIRVRLYSSTIDPDNLLETGYEYDAETAKLRIQPGFTFEHTASCTLIIDGDYCTGAEKATWSVKCSFTIEEIENLQDVTISCTTRFVPAEAIELESINLVEPETENAALCEPQLILNFNKRITDCRIEIYELDETGDFGDTSLETEMTFDLDQVKLIPVDGFEEDKHYVVFLNGEYIAGLNADPEHWVISYEFKYDPIEIIDTTIVRDAVIDESVHRFYWTADLFRDAVNELHEQQNLYYRFTGNTILNRITTDTDVSHWLRVLAPSYADEEIPFGGNYWGTTSERAIGLQIIDQSDFASYATIDYSPYLTEAPENTFPFVTGLTILDETGKETTHLSNQKVTVRITFNRDMDTTVPLSVTFGNEYPYSQYAIPGEYVDARTWEGRYILTTILPNGDHSFTISNGRSAEDGLELYTDWGRFGFELDTASAQALLMQGEATTEGIRLTWKQDDFETLMGYNVYRSTGDANAYAQRVNSTIIPAGTETYLDADVEPGVVYYYSFTVVQTDLSESIPSGKISVMSLDTMAPDLYHTPIYNATTGSNLVISATVRDNVSVGSVYVYYRTVGGTEWNTSVMNKLNDKYTALIAADQLSTEGLEYYIEATDGISSSFKGSAETPFRVEITAQQDVSSKGDVNGDGRINALDALMLLQSINGLVHLNAEEFARADLDGNGILQAMEALRILDYITGKVGSVKMG